MRTPQGVDNDDGSKRPLAEAAAVAAARSWLQRPAQTPGAVQRSFAASESAWRVSLVFEERRRKAGKMLQQTFREALKKERVFQ